jgi:hypothetical protein
MHFFFSGELDVQVADAWQAVARSLEHRLNEALESRVYGPALREIALIPMILRPEWQQGHKERRLFKRKERVADYRTWIAFNRFLYGATKERECLLVANLVAAVHDVGRKAGRGLDSDALVADILLTLGVSAEQTEGCEPHQVERVARAT